MGGNRFWEFYLVRYLLGTIFGVVVLFYLVINYNNEITTSFFKSEISTKIEKLCNNKQNSSEIQKLECKYKKQQAKESLKAGEILGAVRMLPDEEKIGAKIASLLYETTYDVGKEDAIDVLKTLGGTDLFPSKFGDNKITLKQTGFPILAAIVIVVSGFLYMYFSSMIILVLHGIRFAWMGFFVNSKKTDKKGVIFLLSLFLILFFIVMCGTTELRHSITFIVTFLIMIMLILLFPNVGIFYLYLSKYRGSISKISKKTEGLQDPVKSEYIESYKHLREHGNAFGIIVCEIIFAGWLIMWDFSFWAIFYWCLIGFTSWILGSYLEIKAVSEN
ncbi:hypothetical protein [Paenibacillus sp. FSL H8-0034]|uniref:hypothetical protein n=1 Tax=Paenibacillus sp. FSL H8-0034 TaxID=2954671 RepID=UPI0030F57C5D